MAELSRPHHGAWDVDSDMYFLARDQLFQTEKPYSMRYYPGEACPQSNIKRDKRCIKFFDLRKGKNLQFNECGFAVLPLESRMRYEDFSDRLKIETIYLPEVLKAVKRHLGAKRVLVMDHNVRRREPTFPVSTGQDYEQDQPTAMAHIDFSTEEAEKMIRFMYGSKAEAVLGGRWQIVNAWRPLRGPLNDWPLGLCDARTVNFNKDTMPGDIVYTNWATENMQVHYDPSQMWYYLPSQMPHELLIFKSAESLKSCAPGIPHAGFYNPRVQPDEPPRESIETRIFVSYADIEPFPKAVADCTGRLLDDLF